MTAIPNPLLIAHLSILGRYCPGHRCPGHHHDVLTARSGRVLCVDCTETLESERRAAGEVA